MAELTVGINLQAESRNPFQVFGLTILCWGYPIRVEIQRPSGGDFRIQLTQRPCRCVSRICKAGLSGFLAFFVQLSKCLQAKKYLAANLDRCVLVQVKRN